MRLCIFEEVADLFAVLFFLCDRCVYTVRIDDPWITDRCWPLISFTDLSQCAPGHGVRHGALVLGLQCWATEGVWA